MRQQRPRATRELVLWGGSWCRVEDGGGSRCDFEGAVWCMDVCWFSMGARVGMESVGAVV